LVQAGGDESPRGGGFDGFDGGEAALERKVRRFALPVALAVCALLVSTSGGRFLLRLFCGMWIHELGHAVTAWLCGFLAFPGPWLTPVSEGRSQTFSALLSAALLVLAVRCFLDGKSALAGLSLSVLALQLFGSHALSEDRAQMLVVFGGDACCLWGGALLMSAVYAPEGSWPRRDWLRFGFLFIGAAAFCDVFSQWWASRTEFDRIPFGHNEGQGLSDPSRLQETWGWSTDQLVGRYVTLGCLCLCALAALYLWGWYTSREAQE
jgi:hypothetical protein